MREGKKAVTFSPRGEEFFGFKVPAAGSLRARCVSEVPCEKGPGLAAPATPTIQVISIKFTFAPGENLSRVVLAKAIIALIIFSRARDSARKSEARLTHKPSGSLFAWCTLCRAPHETKGRVYPRRPALLIVSTVVAAQKRGSATRMRRERGRERERREQARYRERAGGGRGGAGGRLHGVFITAPRRA